MVAETPSGCKLTRQVPLRSCSMKKLTVLSFAVVVMTIVTVGAGPAGLFSQEVPSDIGLVSRTGLVVSSSDVASDLAADVFGRGGNAVDAAVATAFALAVTHP